MDIFPIRRICTPVVRLCGLSQPGHYADRHLLSRPVKDSFVQRIADCLTKRLHNLTRQREIGVLQGRIANCDKAADLVAVHLNLVEGKLQLVQLGAHLGPDGLRNRSHDVLPSRSGHAPQINARDHLGVFADILADQAKHNVRDSQLRAGDRAVLLPKFTHSRQKFLYILPGQEGIAPLCIQAKKGSGFHIKILLSFFRILGLRRVSGQFLDLGFNSFDLALQLSSSRFIFGLFLLELFHRFLDRGLFLIRFGLVDRLFQFGFPGLELFSRPSKLLQLFFLFVESFLQDQCF